MKHIVLVLAAAALGASSSFAGVHVSVQLPAPEIIFRPMEKVVIIRPAPQPVYYPQEGGVYQPAPVYYPGEYGGHRKDFEKKHKHKDKHPKHKHKHDKKRCDD